MPQAIEESRQMERAGETQRRFMREANGFGDAVECAAQCLQLHEVGGDCYDFVNLPGGRVALAVGDASGKGVAASLMISAAQASLRMAVSSECRENAAIVGAVNRQLWQSSHPDRYVTFFYGVYEPSTRKLQYVNAGHNPPMVLRQGGSIEWLEKGGAPLGMFADWTYEEGSVQLEAGDLLVSYTDGVTEAMNPGAEEFGADGLQHVVLQNGSRPAGEIVEEVFTEIQQFTCGALADDATMAVLRVR